MELEMDPHHVSGLASTIDFIIFFARPSLFLSQNMRIYLIRHGETVDNVASL